MPTEEVPTNAVLIKGFYQYSNYIIKHIIIILYLRILINILSFKKPFQLQTYVRNVRFFLLDYRQTGSETRVYIERSTNVYRFCLLDVDGRGFLGSAKKSRKQTTDMLQILFKNATHSS